MQTITETSVVLVGGLVNAYTDFITHKPVSGKNETRNEGKFVMVTFHPAMMNAILTAIQSAR